MLGGKVNKKELLALLDKIIEEEKAKNQRTPIPHL